MAAASFKQECPSCETMVLVRDPSMVGKKIECPKCKDKFIVAQPPPPEEEEVEEEPAPKAKKKTVAPQAKKKAEAVEEAAPKPAPKKTKTAAKPEEKAKEEDDAKGKPAQKKGKGASENGDVAAAAAVEEDGKKKKKGLALGSKKMALGLGLAIVGVLVLGVAGYFILGRGPSTPPKSNPPPGPPPVALAKPPEEDKKDDENKEDEKKEDKPAPKKTVVAKAPAKVKEKEREKDIEELFETPPDTPLNPAGSDLTNFLPHDTEQIVRINFKPLLEQNSPFRDAAFHTVGAYDDRAMRKKLSFSPLNVDEMIQAERFTSPSWSLTIVHVMENMTPKNLTLALGLQQVKTPIKNQIYYQVQNNYWLEQLGRSAPGVPPTFRQLLPQRGKKPLFVRLHNPQTLVLGDEQVMKAFLQEEGQFRFYGDKEDTPRPEPKKDINPKKDLKDPLKKGPMPPPNVKPPEAKKEEPKKEEPKKDSDKEVPRGSTFMTVKPALKSLIERWQPTEDESKDRVLFATATEMVAAQVVNKLPEYKGLVLHRPRPIWDLTSVMEERSPRLTYLATALVQKDSRVFQYHNDLVCRQQAEARDLLKELADRTLPRVTRFLEQMLDYRIDITQLASKTTDAKPGEGGKLDVPKTLETAKTTDSANTTRITLAQTDSTISVNMDLVLEPVVYGRIGELMGMVMVESHQELALTTLKEGRLMLAKAAHEAAVKGLPEQQVEPGRFPPGTFPRPNSRLRSARDPGQRISWMAGLLPFLGHERLFGKLQFDSSWRDPPNWLPGQTIVPQFLDPTYPANTHYWHSPQLPVDMAATHFVGVAGVGLDAADYPPGDPTYVAKRGILNYERSASLDEVQKGRGLSNTMLMIQVPYDGMASVTPWIAGGGSTLRGIPEKNSIAPFVLSQDRDGNPIQHKGRPGTYVLMADGSVRFVTKSVSDDVFKALATYQGPNPEGFDIDKNEHIQTLTPKSEPAKSETKKDEKKKKK